MTTTGFLSGFRGGFQDANNVMQQRKQDERYNQQVAKSDARYEAGVLAQQQRNDTLDARYEAEQLANQQKATKDEEIRLAGVSRQNIIDKREATEFQNSQEDRKTKQSNLKKKQARDDVAYKKKQRKERYNNVMTSVSNAFSADPTGANITQDQWMQWAEDSKGTNAEVMFDVNKQQASKYLVGQLKTGFKGSDAESIKQATNTYLSGQLNRLNQEGIEDNNGKPMQGMEFSRWADDGKGGLIAHVNVVDGNGETYEAPITQFRSADDDDPIRIYNAEKLFDHLIAENQLINVLSKDGYLQKLNSPNGSAGMNGDTPAAIQTNQYAANIQGISEADAWNQSRQGDQSRQRMKALELAKKSFVNDYGEPMHIAQDGSLVEAGTEGARAPTQQDVVNKADSYVRYSQGDSFEQPQQQPQQQASTPDDLINQAKTAISNGADQQAVIQRLIDNGYTKEQILQQFQ